MGKKYNRAHGHCTGLKRTMKTQHAGTMETKNNKIIRTILLFLFTVMPLAFSDMAYDFIYIKNIIFTLAVSLIFIVFFLQKEIKISKTPFIPLAFIIWMFTSTLHSKYGYRGFEVLQGAIILYLFFFLIANVGKINTSSIRDIIALSSLPAIIIGLIQAVVPGTMHELMVFGGRVPSTLGNPNFFAAYLIAVIPIIFMIIPENKGIKKVLAVTFLLISLFCLFKTGSKAGIVGLLTEAAIFSAVFLSKKITWKKTAIILAALLAVLAIAGILNKDRLMKNDSVFFRVYTWKGTLGIIKTNPFFGTGPGSFSLVYPSYRPMEIMKWASQHSYEVTQPENIILQVMSDTGVIGLGIFLLLIYIVMRKGGGKMDFLAGFSGLFAANLFGVDINYISSSAFFAFYAGIILNTEGKNFEIKEKARYLLMIAGILFFIFAIGRQFKDYKSSIYLFRAVSFSKAGDWNRAIDDYEQAVKLDKYNLDARYFLANAYYDSDNKKNAGKALEKFNELEAMAPDFILLHYKKGSILSGAGQYDMAKQEYLKMLKTDPYLIPALNELMWIYVQEQDYAGAEKCVKQEIEKDNMDAALYNNFGNICMLQKKYAEAVEAYKKAIDLKQEKDYYYNAGCAYYLLKDRMKAKEYLLKAKETDKTNDPKIEKMLERIK
jgi:tetratricopeptide (TPR) repeat protein